MMARYDRPDEPYFFGEVIGSSMSYHRPTCRVISRIAPGNYKRLRDCDEAHALGLKPCPICSPYSRPAAPMPSAAAPTPQQQQSAPKYSPLTSSQLGDRRRALIRLLDSFEQAERHEGEGLAARIGRLSKAAVIPREVAVCMRTITEMRNVAEYEAKVLSHAQSLAVEGAWLVVQEWAGTKGLTVSDES